MRLPEEFHEMALTRFVQLVSHTGLVAIVLAAPKCPERTTLLSTYPACSDALGESDVCDSSRHVERLRYLLDAALRRCGVDPSVPISDLQPTAKADELLKAWKRLYGLGTLEPEPDSGWLLAWWKLFAPAVADWDRTIGVVNRYATVGDLVGDDKTTETKE